MVHDDDRKIKLIDFGLAKAVNTTAYTGWYFILAGRGLQVNCTMRVMTSGDSGVY